MGSPARRRARVASDSARPAKSASKSRTRLATSASYSSGVRFLRTGNSSKAKVAAMRRCTRKTAMPERNSAARALW
nr:MAG: hypothetical protein [Molluscum contagiosum virus]